MQEFTFAEQNRVGREGEVLFRLHLAALPVLFRDVSAEPEYQARGIDYRVVPWAEGPEYTVDVKTDTHDTPNVALELRVSDERGERAGCAVSGEADWWAYIRPARGYMLVLHGPRLRTYARTLTATHTIQNRNPRTGATWAAHVALVRERDLEQAGVIKARRPLPCIDAA